MEKISKRRQKTKENNCNEANIKVPVPFRRPRKYSKLLTLEQIKRLKCLEIKKKKKKSNHSGKRDESLNKPIAVSTSEIDMKLKKPPLLCLQIISNSISVPSTVSKTQVEVPSTVSTVTNMSTSSVLSSTATYTTLTTPIMAASVFVPVKTVQQQSRYVEIKPKLLEIPGKVAIPALKRNSIAVPVKKHKINKKRKKVEKTNDNQNITQDKKSVVQSDDNKEVSKLTETLSTELANDLFANLQVPQNVSNPESLSPTAAYLMNFPLVSTDISSKIADDGNNESHVCDMQEKNANTSLMLEENFSTFFTSNTDNIYNLGEPPPLPTTSVTLPTVTTMQTSYNSSSTLKTSTEAVKQNLKTEGKKLNVSLSQNYQVLNTIANTNAVNSTFTFSLSNTTSSVVHTSDSNTFLPIPPSLPTPIPPLPTPSFMSSKSNLDFLSKPNFPGIKSLDEDFFNYPPKSANSCSSFTFSLTNPVSTVTTTSSQNFYYNKSFPFPSLTTSNTSNFNTYSWEPPPPPASVVVSSQSQNSCMTNFTFSLTSNSSSLPKYTASSAAGTSTYNTYNPFSTDQYDSHPNFIEHKTPTKKNTNIKTKYNTPVNWMTSPQFPPLDFTQPSIIPNTPTSTTSYYPPPIPPPKSDIFFAHPPEDNFPWSPNKMTNILDSSHLNHFIPATLPTLQGDLALSTPAACALSSYDQSKPHDQSKIFDQQKSYEQSKLYDHKPYENSRSSIQTKIYDQNKSYDHFKSFDASKSYETKPYDSTKVYDQIKNFENSKPYEQSKSYDPIKSFNQQSKTQNTNNFFSVNQMIECQKSMTKSKSSTQKIKDSKSRQLINFKPSLPHPAPPTSSWNFIPPAQETMLTYNDYLPPQKQTSIPCNNYSAESLISNQPSSSDHRKRYDPTNYTSSELSYLPHMDFNTDNGNNYNTFLYPNNYSHTNSDNTYYNENFSSKSNSYGKCSSRVSKSYTKSKHFEPTSSYFPHTQTITHAPLSSNLNHSSQITNSSIHDDNYQHQNQQQHLFHSTIPSSSSYSVINHISSNSLNFSSTSGHTTGGNSLANFNVRTICPEINEKNRWG